MRLYRVAAAACVVAAATSLQAQLPTGSIGGIARDTSGARVRGVQVTATSESQGTVSRGRSNDDGAFSLANLRPGAYTVLVTSAGFGEVRYPHVQIEAGKATTLDTTLAASTLASMDVGTTNAQLDLTQSVIQGQITPQTIASIPLNGRTFWSLRF